MAHNVAIVAEFIRKLGDPSKFDYTGRVVDNKYVTGQCVCGHAIRYEYIITDGTREVSVGSECINHFKQYNPDLFERLRKAHEDRLKKQKEDEKRAKELKESKEVKKLKDRYDGLKDKAREIIDRYPEFPWLPYELYSSWRFYLRQYPKDYKRQSSFIRWYKERMDGLEEFVRELEAWADANPHRREEEPKATDRQISYLKALVKKAGHPGFNYDDLTKSEASNHISELKWG